MNLYGINEGERVTSFVLRKRSVVSYLKLIRNLLISSQRRRSQALEYLKWCGITNQVTEVETAAKQLLRKVL